MMEFFSKILSGISASLIVEKFKNFFNKTELKELQKLNTELQEFHKKLQEAYKELKDTYKNQIKLLNDVICYNQGELAQYSFLAGDKHKKIKEGLRNNLNEEKLSTYCKELTNFLDTHLENVWKKNCKYLFEYFNGRSKIPPRFCIKAHHKNFIKDIFRDNRKYDIVSYKKEDNTGFYEVYKSGRYYICNNIPDEVKKGIYFNPRLNSGRVIAYVNKISTNENDTFDMDWVRCWNDIQLKDGTHQQPPVDSCYKSTMIIPMTLLGNTLYPEFKTLYRIEKIENEDDRAIYGYLCFDHHKINYFNEDIDFRIGYIFADILSLYLIERLRYTEYSETFKNALNKQKV